jgi:hypothetical protein
MENLGPIANGTINANGESLFKLGMMFATGCSRPFCLVSAHVCFNFAATQGNERAIELRQEVATEMSREQIAAAQRAARELLIRSVDGLVAARPRVAPC